MITSQTYGDSFEGIEDGQQRMLAYLQGHSTFLASPTRASYRPPTQEFQATMSARVLARIQRQVARREARDARRGDGGHP